MEVEVRFNPQISQIVSDMLEHDYLSVENTRLFEMFNLRNLRALFFERQLR